MHMFKKKIKFLYRNTYFLQFFSAQNKNLRKYFKYNNIVVLQGSCNEN